ncbi:UNVERIFIED_CONTAM: hypothetical protein K2H54_017814 [Gekko kuhli]
MAVYATLSRYIKRDTCTKIWGGGGEMSSLKGEHLTVLYKLFTSKVELHMYSISKTGLPLKTAALRLRFPSAFPSRVKFVSGLDGIMLSVHLPLRDAAHNKEAGLGGGRKHLTKAS